MNFIDTAEKHILDVKLFVVEAIGCILGNLWIINSHSYILSSAWYGYYDKNLMLLFLEGSKLTVLAKMGDYKLTCIYLLSVITMASTTALSDCLNGRTPGCTLPPNQGNQAVLQIQHAKITNIPAGVFREYNHVTTLDLAHNNISVVEPGAFVGLVAMTKLLLSSNALENIRYTTFAGAEKLRYLTLAQNKIGFIEPGSFHGLRRLMLLNLNNNKLTVVPGGVYNGSPHLHYLYMDGNQIHTIAPTAFQTLRELKILRMKRNKLQNIPDIFGDVLKLTRLGISRNPFQCDCRMEFFRQWMRAHGSLISTLIQDPVTCSEPANLAGKDLRFEQIILRCTRPFISQVQTPVEIIEGAEKIIQPQVKGQPAPSLVWSRPSGASVPVRTRIDPGTELRQLQDGERVTVDEDGALIFSRASVEDSGRYTCKATNIAGTFTLAINISVQKKRDVTTITTTTENIANHYGDKNQQVAEEKDGVLKECFNPQATLTKAIFLACLVTFLATSLFLTLIFCCYHKRVLTRSKTFFGHFEPVPERHRMRFAKSTTCESGSSLRTAVTRLSAMSVGSELEKASNTSSKRSQLNSYCSGSEIKAQLHGNVDTNANNKSNEINNDTYEDPYGKPRGRIGTLPQIPDESSETEDYMVPMKSDTLGPTRTYQNSTVCTFDPNYATIDPIAMRNRDVGGINIE